ncbi:General transcription factor II-I repeat domain-containing protein 2 [Eumeta japonica]|uniref:General transcription factor II-I repeat domain-containing protein 2 n=1 Tax=Eumeta variegata TaxID=151549 RepID=A0A4C1YAS6_EUMVA|nr:General transcription factor II-I repeat domain-containing protein 2 [Eumeta japonica]
MMCTGLLFRWRRRFRNNLVATLGPKTPAALGCLCKCATVRGIIIIRCLLVLFSAGRERASGASASERQPRRVLCPEKKNEFEKISLSKRTVVRRIEMMANDIKTTFTDRMAGFESFSMALNKSTDLSDTAQLTIFIRGVDKEFTVTEEFLALQPLKGTTTREDIFNEVQKVFTSFGLPWSKLVEVCTDSVFSMLG